MGPTAYAIASTERPTANATAINPALGAENNAAPQTALTSVNVPMTSALNSRDIFISHEAPANRREPRAVMPSTHGGRPQKSASSSLRGVSEFLPVYKKGNR